MVLLLPKTVVKFEQAYPEFKFHYGATSTKEFKELSKMPSLI